MTTPSQRTTALRLGAELLRNIAQHPHTPAIQRKEAARLIETYPGPDVVDGWIQGGLRRLPAPAAEAIWSAGSLFEFMLRVEPCHEDVREPLRRVLRHYPSAGEVLHWADSRMSRSLAGGWLLPEDSP